MQLDHPNGQVIILDKIDINQNRVTYSRYDYGGENGKFLEQIFHVFTTINLMDYLTEEIVFEELCYNTIVTEKESGYVIEEEVQNWLVPPTAVRVYVPALVFNSVANTGNDLDQLIIQYVEDDWRTLLEGIHYYRYTVNDTERAFLEVYPDIIIEDKI